MNKAFTLFIWENEPSVNTPLGESLLNKVNVGLDEVDNRVLIHETTKANQSDLLTALADITYDEETGIFTLIKKNGATTKLDTNLEKLAVNLDFDYNTQQFILTLSDGTEKYIDAKALVTELDFLNSDTVLFSVTDGKVSASIAKGSITADTLEPNYLANVQLYASQALSSADGAAKSAQEAEASAVRAEEAAEKAERIVGGDFATNKKVDDILNGTTPAGNSTLHDGFTVTEVGESGARNLIPYPYHETTHTEDGVTFTDNGDGTITVNGTATASTAFEVIQLASSGISLPLYDGTYTLSGCPSGGSASTYRLIAFSEADNTISLTDTGDGATRVLADNVANMRVRIAIASGTTVSNLTFKPMLEIGSVAHDFVPYHFGGAEDALKLNGLTAKEFVCNPNLLINSDFRNPVNSSGLTEWSGNDIETIDGWFTGSQSSEQVVTLKDEYIEITYTGNTKRPNFASKVVNDYVFLLRDKKVTLSVKYKTNSNDILIGLWDGSIKYGATNGDGNWNVYTQTINITNTTRFCEYHTILPSGCDYDGVYIDIEWVKLEIGSVPTPLSPDNMNIEKLKCGATVGDADTVDGYHASDFARHGAVAYSAIDDITLSGLYGVYENPCLILHITWDRNYMFQIMNPYSYAMKWRIKYDGKWSIWNSAATKADLANYLPLTGGTLSSSALAQLILKRIGTGGNAVQFVNDNGTLGYLGISSVGEPLYWDKDLNAKNIIHTGNSNAVIKATTAPSNTTAVWVDTTNKKVKAYIDGAWTVIS